MYLKHVKCNKNKPTVPPKRPRNSLRKLLGPPPETPPGRPPGGVWMEGHRSFWSEFRGHLGRHGEGEGGAVS